MAGKEYKFYEETHTHTIGGAIVPGITTLLKPLYDFSHVPEHILSAACSYGSNVHKSVELYCYGTLDIDELDPKLISPLSAFQQWLKDYRFKTSDFIVEVPMGDPRLMVACIPDLILDGKLIVDLKTRKANHVTDSIQTVCQEHIWKQNGGERVKEYERRVLELKQDGTYTYTKVNDRQAMPRFRKLLDYYYDTQLINSWRKS